MSGRKQQSGKKKEKIINDSIQQHTFIEYKNRGEEAQSAPFLFLYTS